MASQYIQSLMHPGELTAMVKYKVGNVMEGTHDYSNLAPSMQKCYSLLNKTSRSFAAVIQRLDGSLKPAICIFYLVLRGLDTVEDDMTLSVEKKTPILETFHERLYEKGWTFTESGPNEKDRILLVEFNLVIEEFLKLDKVYQDVIADICKRMGHGMSKYLTATVQSEKDWDEYCHYVAGLVGIGLSGLFSASGFEEEAIGKDVELANSMGLFLQKTNIIRDYLEDMDEGRIFWPSAVWKKYATNLEDFKDPEHVEKALFCLNHLITNALQHVSDCFTYMSRLRDAKVFDFCAVPQVMAIATLSACFNNINVFRGVVKIRKGEAVKLILECRNMDYLYLIFFNFATDIESRIDEKDPSATRTRSLCREIKANAIKMATRDITKPETFISSETVVPAAIAALAAYYYYCY
eukprot:Nk52_evm4s159 gene=Nk52_evmTU4s159